MAPAPICPYCNIASELKPNSVVYGDNSKYQANIWLCVNYPRCDAFIGVYPAPSAPIPVGTMANGRLRFLRSQIHRLLEPRWRKSKTWKITPGERLSKNAAYKQVASQLGWGNKLHVAVLDEDQCLKALNVINPDFIDVGDSTKEEFKTWIKD